MALRKAALAKALVVFSLALALHNSVALAARHDGRLSQEDPEHGGSRDGGGGNPAHGGSRDGGGGHGYGDPCEKQECALVYNPDLNTFEPVSDSVEIQDQDDSDDCDD